MIRYPLLYSDIALNRKPDDQFVKELIKTIQVESLIQEFEWSMGSLE